jgi:hypothetical protein
VSDDGPEARPFARQFFVDRDDLVAARWWQEGMNASAAAGVAAPMDESRRAALLAMGVVGAVAVSGVFARYLQYRRDPAGWGDGTPVITEDALVLQRRDGWNVGATDKSLYFHGAITRDAAGEPVPSSELGSLTSELAPARLALLPYYVPTLFQAVSTTNFRDQVQMVDTPAMDRAAVRGRALAQLFGPEDDPTTALLIDVPGPEAVAVAAGASDRFEPVFLFDNWPHPNGVVASHEVAGAVIYYRPALRATRWNRSENAPPAFVIDRHRLDPYRDASDAFDNRYLARMPSASALLGLGVRHLLYVTAEPVDFEADDLNDDFVAYARDGIDVKMVALTDFRPVDAPVTTAVGPVSYGYGGSAHGHAWFWHSYGWVHAPAPPPSARPPIAVSAGAAFRPQSRPTIFSSRTVGGLGGFGKQKPSGFGRVSFRSGGNGTVEIGRSGSLGRTRSFGGWGG